MRELIDSLAEEEEEEDDDDEQNRNLIWFTVTINKYSGKVISAAIGRIKIAQKAASDANIHKYNDGISD